MHPAVLDQRNQEARRRITAAAAALVDALGIAPLVPPTAIERRQPPVAQMRELEAIADVLEAVGEALLETKEPPNGKPTKAQGGP